MRYAAFLAAINVGGNRLAMATLKSAFEAEGFTSVETVLASGNVLFDGPECGTGADRVALAARIGQGLERQLGLASVAIVCDAVALDAAIAGNPFAHDGADNQVHVHFLERDPDPDAFARLVGDHGIRGRERLATGPGCLYIDYRDGVGDSKLTAAFIARRIGCRGTARNLRTLSRILKSLSTG